MKQIFSLFQKGIHNVMSNVTITIFQLYQIIKNDVELIEATTRLRNITDQQLFNKYKSEQLISITPGGIFFYRSETRLRELSLVICVDIDKCSELISIRKALIEKCKFLILLFISPSSKGLKLFFRCNPNFNYKENYKALTIYLSKQFDIPLTNIDQSCSNVAKACFLSHDPEAYLSPLINENDGLEKMPILGAEYFSIENELHPNTNNDELKEVFEENEFENPAYVYYQITLDLSKRNLIDNFKQLVRLNIRSQGHLRIGHRHLWFLNLAMLCNRFGMKQETAVAYCEKFFTTHSAIIDKSSHFDFKKEILRSFEDTYENFQDDFSTWENHKEDYETPLIPNKAYDKLPTKIQKLTSLFKNRERDIFFIGLLTLLSTLFPKIRGRYYYKVYRMNLFSFIVAPQASGKGVLSWIRMCGSKIHEAFIESYKQELKEFNELPDEDKKNTLPPTMQKLFFPADITGPMTIKNIEANKVFGFVMDTEADTMTNANKSEHGNFSTLFRKCFEHEAIQYERKTSKEYYYIENPALSILISGTPKQVNRLMYDVENGFTSRFLFYSYVAKSEWKDVFADGEDYEYIFKSVANELSELVNPYLVEYLKEPDNEILFDLTIDQKKSLNSWFSDKLVKLNHLYGNDIDGSVKRLGVINFRIAMILTAIRSVYSDCGNKSNVSNKLYCSDTDFEIAQQITDTLLYHTVSIFNHLKSKGAISVRKKNQEVYIEKLPEVFNWEKAREVANFLAINHKTAENYLKRAIIDGTITKNGHNDYRKPKIVA